ncbi:hypothetical protein CP10743SC13_2066, partial [Chlamydia psittaci 10_743_SC13]
MRKSRVFSLKIPHLCEKHAVSLRETPLNLKITRFLFRNTTFKR